MSRLRRIHLSDDRSLQDIPGIPAAVFAAADDDAFAEAEAGADAVGGVGVGAEGLEEVAVGFVEEADGGGEG